MSEVVYIFTNPHMPYLALVGHYPVGTVEKELQRLYSEGVPDCFVCEYAAEVADAKKVENEVRQKFSDAFVSHERGFFVKKFIEKIKEAIQKYQIKDFTPDFKADDSNKNDHKPKKRGKKFYFHKVGIEKGKILRFVKRSTITCTVHDNNKVVFEGKKEFFSYATKKSPRKNRNVYSIRSVLRKGALDLQRKTT